jgi:SMODS-associated and fused to various effectors sensor domain
MSKNPLTRISQSRTNIKQIVSIIRRHPREIIVENTIVNFAAIVAGIGSLVFSVTFPTGVIGVFLLSLAIVAIGTVTEAQKYFIYTQESLPIPIVINIANPANELDALNSLFTIIQQEPPFSNYQKNIHKYLGISSDDLVYKFGGDIFDTERLKDFLKITKHDLGKIKQKTPQNSQFHLVYIGPASVAFLVGSMLGREGLKIFQRNQEDNSYKCIAETRDRLLKEEITSFDKFKFELIKQREELISENITVAIDTASHRLNINDPAIQNYGDIGSLENKNGNTILFEEDWLQYCREIFHVLNEQQQGYKEIKLIYSMPVSLAITVGMAVQHFWNIQLTNYDPQTGTYRNLIKMNEVIF